MINKIGNWVFGSFFRTIGRLLVFVLLGFIIANLVDFSDIISNFRITDLFFEKVDALSLDGNIYRLVEASPTTHVVKITDNNRQDTWTFTNVIQNDTGDYIVFPFSGFIGIDQTLEETSTGSINYIYQGNVFLQISILSNTGGNNKVCEIQNNMIVCPINHNANYYTLYIELNGDYTSSDSEINVDLRISGYPTIYKVNGTQAIIDNQNQNTQQQMEQQEQQHEEMMDSNTTQAEDEAEGFFGDFSVPDTGGLSGIITAPLNTIRSLLNSTCTNLVLPLPFVNKNLTLPCLYDIYNEHFGAFFTIYQTIVLAIVAYRCIRSIYFDIHGFMDPNDDRIEVMDL